MWIWEIKCWSCSEKNEEECGGMQESGLLCSAAIINLTPWSWFYGLKLLRRELRRKYLVHLVIGQDCLCLLFTTDDTDRMWRCVATLASSTFCWNIIFADLEKFLWKLDGESYKNNLIKQYQASSLMLHAARRCVGHVFRAWHCQGVWPVNCSPSRHVNGYLMDCLLT